VALLASGATRPKFNSALIRRVWRFGAGYSANSLANLALLQGDKIILSAVLPLEMFGWYTLAQRLAGGIYAIIVAVDGAIFPRFSAAVAVGDESALARVYHRGCRIMALLVVPLAVVLGFFSAEVLQLWTGNAVAVANARVVLTLLAAGMLLHGLVQGPMFLQIAYGWWRLISTTNALLVVTILPLYFVMAKLYGGAGAALVWLVLNVAYLATVPLMHRRFLRGEQRRWLLSDVALPLAGALAIAAAAHALLPSNVVSIIAAWLLITAAAAAPLVATGVRPAATTARSTAR